MFSRWPIRHKLLVGLVLVLVIVGTLSWSGFHGLYGYRNLVKSISWRVNEVPLAAELSQRVSDLRVSLTDIRDFHVDDRDGPPVTAQIAREDFRAKRHRVEEALDRYRAQLANSEQFGWKISDAHRQRQTVSRIEQTLAHIADIDRDEDWILDTVRVGQLRPEVERLQVLAAELPASLHGNILEFAAEARGQYRASIVLAWVTTALAFLLMATGVWMFYRWIFRPLNVLICGSRRVASGQFQYRIHLNTNDEMSELADAMNDMTERFQAIRDDLDRQVKERTKQVVRSEQLASVGFLAAGVAHEINNPLASIAISAESLEGRIRGLLAPQNDDHKVVGQYLRMIQDEAFRCKEITEKLLDFSRMGEVQRQNTDLRELVQGVIDMLRHVGKYQQRHIEFLPGEGVIAPVNPQEIKQVVLNLLTNGLDALDAGGTVTVELESRGEFAELRVADDGCGMTPETIEHLFEPFFTRRRGGQGIGLGLSITYRIIADHDGHIDADSAGPGTGSTFRVRLPRAAPEKEKRHQYQAA